MLLRPQLNSLVHGQMDTDAPFASAFAVLAASGGGGARRTLFLQTSARFVSFGAFTGDCRPISTLSRLNLLLCHVTADWAAAMAQAQPADPPLLSMLSFIVRQYQFDSMSSCGVIVRLLIQAL